MSLFRELGRRVAQFTTDVQTTDGSTAYRCEDCGTRFAEPRERCSECDSRDVAPVEQGA